MADYILSCCSTADLSKEHFDSREIHYICFHFMLDGVDYPDDLGVSVPFDEFYRRMAEGSDTRTSQVNVSEYVEYFTPFLEAGKDVLHVSLSGGLSGTVNAAPVGVDHALAVFLGADAVPPVIFVGEAAAGPAKHGDLYGPQRLHRVGAHPVDVADLAVLAHVQAVIDTPAQMLRKMPEKVPANGSLGLLGGYGQLCHGDSFLR